MTFPTVRFRVAFDSDPLDSTPTHTDLSTRVESFTFDYGKQSALDDFQPGTSSVVLKNDDRELDPLYAAGTYFGKLKPRKRCVLDATYSGTTYDQFTTFANGWPQRYAPPTMSYVDLAGTDLFILLGNIGLPPSVWMLEASADDCFLWWRLNEVDGTIVNDSSGNHHDGELQYARVDNIDNAPVPAVAIGEPLIKGEDSSSMILRGGVDGTTSVLAPAILMTDLPTALPLTIEAWALHDIAPYNVISQIVDMEFNGIHLACYLDPEGTGMTTFSPKCLWWNATSTYNNIVDASTAPDYMEFTSQPRHVVFVLDATGNEIYVDGVLVSPASGTSAGAAATKTFMALGHVRPYDGNDNQWWSGRLGDIRLYESALSATRIAAHADAGLTPWTGDTTGERMQRITDYSGIEAGDLDLDTGIVILGPTSLGGDALAELQKLALTEDGSLHVEHRNGGKLTFYDRFVRFTATRSTTSQATFTDDPAASAPAYRFEPDDLVLTDDESQIVNEAIVQWDQGEARVSDAASILAHGLKSRTYATRLKSAEEAQGRAEWIVANYKDAHVRIQSLTLNPAADSRLWPVALGLRYLDRITFRFHPQGVGTAIQNDYWIQGVHVEASEGVNHWLTTYYVTPASAVGADVEVFILDSSLLDGDAILV